MLGAAEERAAEARRALEEILRDALLDEADEAARALGDVSESILSHVEQAASSCPTLYST